MASEANLVEVVDHTLYQRLKCIYDYAPLSFKKDPMTLKEEIQAQDPFGRSLLRVWKHRNTYLNQCLNESKPKKSGDTMDKRLQRFFCMGLQRDAMP